MTYTRSAEPDPEDYIFEISDMSLEGLGAG